MLIEENSDNLFFDKTLATLSLGYTNAANSLAQHY